MSSDSDKQAADWAARFAESDDAERLRLLDSLAQLESGGAAWDRPLGIVARDTCNLPLDGSLDADRWAEGVAAAYRSRNADSAARYWLLLLLNRTNSDSELRMLAELLAADPPAQSDAAAAVVSRLLHRPPADPKPLYPRLLDAIAHRSAAAAVLDLTNYYFRAGVLAAHPAADRCGPLAQLLAGLVKELRELEGAGADDAQQDIAQRIDDSVALAIALCEALGQVGGSGQLESLRMAAELSHRRIRVVAAAALARLGDEDGKKLLLQMAAEPVARLQAIEFAKELELLDDIDPKFRSPQSLAESRLAFWLAQPTQFGIPPTRMELQAERELYWPGFDDPQTLFLFRYEYQVGEAKFGNVALSGAHVDSCGADLSHLSEDDCFALFAGKGIDHEEVFEVAADAWSAGHQLEAARLEAQIRAAGYEDFQPETLCFFFDAISIAGQAVRDREPCVLVASAEDTIALPTGNSQRPLGVAEAVAIARGREALKTFNV